MKYCQNCGNTASDNAEYCSVCGTAFDDPRPGGVVSRETNEPPPPTTTTLPPTIITNQNSAHQNVRTKHKKIGCLGWFWRLFIAYMILIIVGLMVTAFMPSIISNTVRTMYEIADYSSTQN